jgi:putative transposase
MSTDDLTLKPLDQLPSVRQFSYWRKKAFDDLTVLRSRKGGVAGKKTTGG